MKVYSDLNKAMRGGKPLLRNNDLENSYAHPTQDRPFWQSALFLVFLVAVCFIGSCTVITRPAHAQMLSPNFSKAEFNQHSQPLPLSAVKVDPLLVKKLEDLRRICMNRPIIITSGYRSKAYNAKVGGVRNSQHLLGKAADIRVNGIDNRMLANYARAVGFKFVKTYSDHVHVDVRP